MMRRLRVQTGLPLFVLLTYFGEDLHQALRAWHNSISGRARGLRPAEFPDSLWATRCERVAGAEGNAFGSATTAIRSPGLYGTKHWCYPLELVQLPGVDSCWNSASGVQRVEIGHRPWFFSGGPCTLYCHAPGGHRGVTVGTGGQWPCDGKTWLG